MEENVRVRNLIIPLCSNNITIIKLLVQDLLEPEYSVYCSGRASQELLEVVRLLLAKEGLYTSLTQKHHHVKFSELKSKEKSFLHRYNIIILGCKTKLI